VSCGGPRYWIRVCGVLTDHLQSGIANDIDFIICGSEELSCAAHASEMPARKLGILTYQHQSLKRWVTLTDPDTVNRNDGIMYSSEGL
jgi:hypothetical protein